MQFLYGEDGLDVTQEGFVRQFGFQARNAARVAAALDLASAQAAPHDAAAEVAAAKANRCVLRQPAQVCFHGPVVAALARCSCAYGMRSGCASPVRGSLQAASQGAHPGQASGQTRSLARDHLGPCLLLPICACNLQASVAQLASDTQIAVLCRLRQRARAKGKAVNTTGVEPGQRLPLSGHFRASCLGVTAEAFADALADFVRLDPEKALQGSAAAKREKVRCSMLLAQAAWWSGAGAPAAAGRK